MSAEVPDIAGVSDLELIGRGGAGLIFRGRQEALSRDVAVKVLATPPMSKASLDRWQRELDAMGRLSNHPNIVAVYDSGLTPDGRPYLVMPFVADGSLGDKVRRSGPLDSAEAIEIGIKIAHALSAAHDAGVLHRDVKPDNVLLSAYGPQLADFGIARLADSTTTAATAFGEIHATINYAAPEVLSGEPASAASDVYGLAATLFTALRSEVPFPHATDASPVAVAHQIIHEPTPSLGGTVPAEVAALIAQAMAKDPKERPPTAADFASALERLVGIHDVDTTVAGGHGVDTTEVFAPVQGTRDAIRMAPRPQPATQPFRERAAPETDRRRGVILGVVVLALVAVALIYVRASGDDPQDGPGAASVATTAVAAPGTGVAPARGQPEAAGDAAVAATAKRYFTRLSQGDYSGAYAMLSPGFKAVQTQASFERFWRTASPVSITGPVSARGLSATVPVRMGNRPNNFVLTLARADGTLFIDGPRPR